MLAFVKESLLTIVTGVHGEVALRYSTQHGETWRAGFSIIYEIPLGPTARLIKSRRQVYRFRDSRGSRHPA